MAVLPAEGMLAAANGSLGVVAAGQPVIWLPPDSAFFWTWGLMLALGAAVQLFGLLSRRRLFLSAGACLVCAAALLDRDPTLFVGQLLLLAGLFWLCAPAVHGPPFGMTQTSNTATEKRSGM